MIFLSVSLSAFDGDETTYEPEASKSQHASF